MIHSAILDIPENADYESFLKTTAIHAGLSFKCFADIDAARAWLKSRQRKSSGLAGDNRENEKGK